MQVGCVIVEWDVSYRVGVGWVMQGWGGMGHEGVDHQAWSWVCHAGVGSVIQVKQCFQTHPTHPSITPVMSCDVIDMMRLSPLPFLAPYFGVPNPT